MIKIDLIVVEICQNMETLCMLDDNLSMYEQSCMTVQAVAFKIQLKKNK